MTKPLTKEERAELWSMIDRYPEGSTYGENDLRRYEATVAELERKLANAEADAEMWEQSAKEHMGLCVKLEQRLREVTNSDDRDAQVMQKNRTIRELERKLAVAVEALEEYANPRNWAAEYPGASQNLYCHGDAREAAEEALSRINGKEGDGER